MAKSSEFGFGFFVRVWVISLCPSLGVEFAHVHGGRGNGGTLQDQYHTSTNELGFAGVEGKERVIIRRIHRRRLPFPSTIAQLAVRSTHTVRWCCAVVVHIPFRWYARTHGSALRLMYVELCWGIYKNASCDVGL